MLLDTREEHGCLDDEMDLGSANSAPAVHCASLPTHRYTTCSLASPSNRDEGRTNKESSERHQVNDIINDKIE
jgi:hypothetical protein